MELTCGCAVRSLRWAAQLVPPRLSRSVEYGGVLASASTTGRRRVACPTSDPAPPAGGASRGLGAFSRLATERSTHKPHGFTGVPGLGPGPVRVRRALRRHMGSSLPGHGLGILS